MSEEAWKAARHLHDAADKATRAADRLEEVGHQLKVLFEDGYGGNALRLIELMESAEPKPDQVVVDRHELMALCERCINNFYGSETYLRAKQMLLKINPQSTPVTDRSASSR